MSEIFRIDKSAKAAVADTDGVSYVIYTGVAVFPPPKDNETTRARAAEIITTEDDGPGFDVRHIVPMPLFLHDQDFDEAWAELGERVKQARDGYIKSVTRTTTD